MTSPFAHLIWDELEGWAGETSVARGRGYVSHVEELHRFRAADRLNNRVVAYV